MRRSEARQERENIGFYADLASHHDPERSFPAPTAVPNVSFRAANPRRRVHRPRPRPQRLVRQHLRADQPGDARASGETFKRNNIVRFQHWRHSDGPRPTLCVIHGFMGSPYLVNGLFFSLPWFYRSGYDVLLYTLPFHGRRAEKNSPFSGYGYFAGGMTGFAEAMGQAVYDFRTVLNWLRHNGVDRIALTGHLPGRLHLGAGGVSRRPPRGGDPQRPAGDAGVGVRRLVAGQQGGATTRIVGGMSREEAYAGFAYHSPLNYQPKVPKDRRLIITGLGDRLAPPDHAEALWKHWDRCALHWFPGNHVLHVSQPEYLRRTNRFLRPLMFD